MKIRLIESPLAIPKYRQIRLPTVAAAFTPFADVEINDENIEPINEEPVDIVGFTAQAYNADRAIYLSKRFRSLGIKTIVGGPYATAFGKNALNFFDAVIVGEIEGLGQKIVQDYLRNNLKGVYCLDKPPINWGTDLPRRDLQQHDQYYWFNFPIEFSRGCPHGCSFCFGRYAHPTYRTRSIKSIEKELSQYDHGLIEAVDLHFAANQEYIVEVCNLLSSLNIPGWFGEATLQSLNDEKLLKHLEKSNLKAVFIGIESIDKNELLSVNKGFNKIELYKDIIKRVQDHGIFVHAGLMWGLDGNNKNIYKDTARFCEETGIYLASANIATFYPGTEVYQDARSKKRILTDDQKSYDSMHVVIQSSNQSETEIYEGAKTFIKDFYGLRSIWKRSFQKPCYRFSQWIDFLAFNFIYRSYYNLWSKRLGKTDSPWHVKNSEKKSFPYVGGKMPLIYNILNHFWKFFHHWYKLWDSPSLPSSFLITTLLCLITGGTSIFLWKVVNIYKIDYWPLQWPPAFPVFCIFFVASIINSFIISQIKFLPEIKPNRTIKFFLSFISFSPIVISIRILPQSAKIWSLFMSFMLITYILKTISLYKAKNNIIQNRIRIISFLLFYPTLDYKESFILDSTKLKFSRHFPKYFIGLLKFLIGILLSFVVFYIVLMFQSQILLYPSYVLRLIVIYLLLSGSLEAITAYWRMAGYVLKDSFGPNSFSIKRPTLIWKSWNTPMYRWLKDYIYIPTGGSRCPILSVTLTFLFSGLIFTLLFSQLYRIHWSIIIFFLINSFPVTFEKIISKHKTFNKSIEILLYFISIFIFLISAPLFFKISDLIIF